MDRYFDREWERAYVSAYEAVYDFSVISGTAQGGYLKSKLPRVQRNFIKNSYFQSKTDITLVTQCSIDRLPRLEEQGSKYPRNTSE
jgi:hypothetical protein